MACLWTDKENYKGWLISAISILGTVGLNKVVAL